MYMSPILTVFFITFKPLSISTCRKHFFAESVSSVAFPSLARGMTNRGKNPAALPAGVCVCVCVCKK